MPNPYDGLAETAFWKKAVAGVPPDAIFPVGARGFRLTAADRIATAGSCFAQNVGKYLRQSTAVQLLQTEALGPEDPVFSGRYGNIYTPRQLNELLAECESGQADPGCAILRRDGRYVDAFRPFIDPAGHATAAGVLAARAAHIAAIRPVFYAATLFVFTLGLTEAWCADSSGGRGMGQAAGRAYPVCPGIYADDPAHPYRFHNFGFAEVLADMTRFIARLGVINPGARVLLTVSPVPLTATYGTDHVLTATMHSKSILRAVCGELAGQAGNVHYFPSYEMVANPYTPGSAYEANLRSVRADVVQRIMGFFAAEYMGGDMPVTQSPAPVAEAMLDELICDDLAIEHSMGF